MYLFTMYIHIYSTYQIHAGDIVVSYTVTPPLYHALGVEWIEAPVDLSVRMVDVFDASETDI